MLYPAEPSTAFLRPFLSLNPSIIMAANANRMIDISQLNKNDMGLVSPPNDVIAQIGPSINLIAQIRIVPRSPIRTAEIKAVPKPLISIPTVKAATMSKIRARTGHLVTTFFNFNLIYNIHHKTSPLQTLLFLLTWFLAH